MLALESESSTYLGYDSMNICIAGINAIYKNGYLLKCFKLILGLGCIYDYLVN